jgi:RsiW-degrading membrane proteinase PrsW (M82 family)
VNAGICPVFVAAFTEEMAKYLVGRRYRRKLDSGIGCRGVIACAASAALGLAATEHVMYSVGYMATSSVLGGLLSSLVRAVIALPLHVGTVRLQALILALGLVR